MVCQYTYFQAVDGSSALQVRMEMLRLKNYMFEGMVGSSLHNSLYQLDLKNMTLIVKLHLMKYTDSPMKKSGCGMITQ